MSYGRRRFPAPTIGELHSTLVNLMREWGAQVGEPAVRPSGRLAERLAAEALGRNAMTDVAVSQVSGAVSRVASDLTGVSARVAGLNADVSGLAEQFDQTDFLYRTDIVGAVSGSPGAPDGAVLEYGSNADGRYLRLADGTQVCWHTTGGNLDIGTAFMGGYASAPQTWTYPRPFAGMPVPFGSPLGATALSCLFGAVTAGSADWLVTAAASQAAASRSVALMAVGRWL